jgi:hypothetical protein
MQQRLPVPGYTVPANSFEIGGRTLERRVDSDRMYDC